MDIIWAIISVIAIVLITFVMVFVRKDKKNKKPVAEIALIFVLVGILIGENAVWGYLLMAIGAILAIIDIILK